MENGGSLVEMGQNHEQLWFTQAKLGGHDGSTMEKGDRSWLNHQICSSNLGEKTRLMGCDRDIITG